MNTAKFWSLIEEARQQSAGSTDRQRELLIQVVSDLSEADIQVFDELWWLMLGRSYRTDLWDAVSLIICFCSDDGFEDFQNWLIAQGQSIYEKVLEDPENLVDIVAKEHRFDFVDAWMGYIGGAAYERKTKRPMPENEKLKECILIGGSFLDGNELPAKFPRIMATIGGCDDENLFS